MQKAKKNSIFLIFSLALVLLCMLAVSLVPASTFSAGAATEVFANNLPGVTMNVTAYNANRAVVDGTTKDVTISGGEVNKTTQAKSYEWKDVKYFKVSMADLNEITLGTKLAGSEYSYKYTVTYFPSTIANGSLAYNNAAIMTKDFYSFTSATIDGIKDEVYFFIDDNEATYKQTTMEITSNANTEFGETYSVQGGWGVYVFTFTCDEKDTSGSFVYELTPTTLEQLKDEVLTIQAEIVPSAYSINNAYLFSVSDKFQYVNRANIVWTVTGAGSDGTKYVLFEAHKTPNNESALYPETGIKNTGATFKFDRNIQGKWKATATITEGTLVKTATSEEVSTIKPFSTTAIVIIVTSVTVVAVAIVTIIIVVTIKKERTW